MIIQLEKGIIDKDQELILDKIKDIGYKSRSVITQKSDYLVCIGKKEFDIRVIGKLNGVRDVHRVSDDYKLVSRKWKVKASMVNLGDKVVIKEGGMSIAAGPCSIENEDQVKSILKHLKKNGISIMRGGVFKPRSSPYSFRGLGIEGLKMFYNEAKRNKIKIITEVMQVSQIEEMYDYVDVFQVGARNTQNYNLLDALGEQDKPVLLKRGVSGTIDELLYSAEYIFSGGNERLILCERGIRTYENAYRNTLDLNAIPILKEKSHLPVFVDPSHGIGIRKHVASMALAGVMAGADGVLLEIHEKPEEAFSDGQQTLNFEESNQLFKNIKKAFELRIGI
ncbi:MAG: 3-deoxy-7-phosphoheptulonate synthase [Bacteroidetes bacterium]|nr:MAG: 3-deoxy-7-phosphoheptulonate synthase [Bacteroidota bacterium]